MYLVGKINREIYRCITEDIVSDEVIITEERIGHIRARHPGDYDQYIGYITSILESPDYILEANKPNSGIILKRIGKQGERFKVILRIKTENDPENYRNSILSFWLIGDTTWNKNVRNKKILYRKE